MLDNRNSVFKELGKVVLYWMLIMTGVLLCLGIALLQKQ